MLSLQKSLKTCNLHARKVINIHAYFQRLLGRCFFLSGTGETGLCVATGQHHGVPTCCVLRVSVWEAGGSTSHCLSRHTRDKQLVLDIRTNCLPASWPLPEPRGCRAVSSSQDPSVHHVPGGAWRFWLPGLSQPGSTPRRMAFRKSQQTHPAEGPGNPHRLTPGALRDSVT